MSDEGKDPPTARTVARVLALPMVRILPAFGGSPRRPPSRCALPRTPLSWNRARTFVASDTADPWKANMPAKSYNDLATVDHNQAVWVNTLAADSFTVAGLVPSGVTLTLQPGWNFVGFPSFRDAVYTLADLKSVPQGTMVENITIASLLF